MASNYFSGCTYNLKENGVLTSTVGYSCSELSKFGTHLRKRLRFGVVEMVFCSLPKTISDSARIDMAFYRLYLTFQVSGRWRQGPDGCVRNHLEFCENGQDSLLFVQNFLEFSRIESTTKGFVRNSVWTAETNGFLFFE